MRQKMISNEINLLRDTFQRLIRRKANTNLGKLIDKTHPADLALLFRFFNEIEQNKLFKFCNPVLKLNKIKNFKNMIENNKKQLKKQKKYFDVFLIY